MTDDTTITDSERDLLRFPAIADVLRFGTPVRSNNPERTYKGQAVILSVDPGRREARVAYARDIFSPEWVSLDDIALDLTDATGRAHLAWWAKSTADAIYGDMYRISSDLKRALASASSGSLMEQEQVVLLRNACLHIAGLDGDK